jgi:tricorn protease-like protein
MRDETQTNDRCDFCKRESDKLTLVNDYDFACVSCGEKVVPVEVRNGDEIVETVWRVPRRDGKIDRVTYKGKRYQLFGGWIQLLLAPRKNKVRSPSS